MGSFVPLRIFSSYTMLEGAIEPKAIAKRARSWASRRRR
jgi:DNA polymerase-3 subunit alpha